MKRLFCSCGEAVYFENLSCFSCSRLLAFNPLTLEMQSVSSDDEAAAPLEFCANRSRINCNWIATPGDTRNLCLSCATSRIIPALDKPRNRDRWRKLETAKRRLLYDLMALQLPVNPAHLSFVFKEDRRSNPDVYEEHVSIGHAWGEITINAAEADDAYRARMRQQMNEPYRTLLGHFRHESGHYYFSLVVTGYDLSAARGLFGDERLDYAAALREHYASPREDWQRDCISSYASSHPMEDWAETWAHYLHIRSVLESAQAQGLYSVPKGQIWHVAFIDLILRINEISRSLGLADAYPFLLTEPVIEKLKFVHDRIAGHASAN